MDVKHQRIQDLATLGLGPNATIEMARKAWRVCARRHHPDQPGGDSATMARINAAWDRLQVHTPAPPPTPSTYEPTGGFEIFI